jgi:hypothetical protein
MPAMASLALSFDGRALKKTTHTEFLETERDMSVEMLTTAATFLVLQ